MRIWDDLGTEYQLSVPYVARVVKIESMREISQGEPVTKRQLEYGAWR